MTRTVEVQGLSPSSLGMHTDAAGTSPAGSALTAFNIRSRALRLCFFLQQMVPTLVLCVH